MPGTQSAEDRERLHKLGSAQRHLFYSILRLGLPCPGRDVDAQHGLVFDFLEDSSGPDGKLIPAMTGHEDGLISLRAAEADDDVREAVRVSMGEPYRTLLGHFRHEIGHFYFQQLVAGSDMVEEARVLRGCFEEKLRKGAAIKLAGAFHLNLCQLPSFRGFRGMLGPLFSYRGHTGIGTRFWTFDRSKDP
jgi:hypothetical protein